MQALRVEWVAIKNKAERKTPKTDNRTTRFRFGMVLIAG